MSKNVAELDHQLVVTERKTCRVCYSNRLVSIFSLGSQYVSNFVKKGETGIKAPLELVLCENCSLLQLKNTAPQELLYSRFYWYHSGLTQTMKYALKEIAETAAQTVNLKEGDMVLDIGANDGTLLSFYPKGIIRVGCEPANNLIEELKQNCEYVIHDFWSYNAYERLGVKKAKVVTAIGMFYDMEDPNQFVSDAQKAMSEDGIFVAQLMCLKNMLEKNDVGNVCHEHLEFYSLESLKYLFEKNGLEIFKIEENDINGGSYRLYAKHYKNGSIPFDEKFTKEDYLDFYKRIEENKKKCVNFIKQEVKKGKKVYVYGASTKGNTILQYYGLTNEYICGAADKSPEKWGRCTIGTWIPIMSEEEARKKADYFLVLPYAFLNEFLEREKEWLEKGGKFIVPLPEFRVIKYQQG
ncbi:methyltransferase domain-containing protein [Candidatus Woesearchaeota archaeon]|nr:methyltransferase domain-containing protein [Candidatus Woesearchaeota archaeon]